MQAKELHSRRWSKSREKSHFCIDQDGATFAVVCGGTDAEAEHLATAIAALPDLLWHLKDMTARLELATKGHPAAPSMSIDSARAIIAKVEGQ